MHPCIAFQRKKTLLVEYKLLRKANTFIDRRFGGTFARQSLLQPRCSYTRTQCLLREVVEL